MVDSNSRQPSMLQAFIPLVFLIGLLALSVYLYGEDSSYGGNQIALILSAAITVLIGLRNGQTWKELEAGIVEGISLAMGAMLILLVVGSLIGSWILSGTVPTMIYYGMQVLSPSFFYVASCIICAVVALSIGSSWTTAGTIGVGLVGIAHGLDLSPEITAGAIISGAYFGDKMSPLSDTTNLAPAVTGTDLFVHIRHMVWTTGPSLAVALVAFLIIGLSVDSNASVEGLEETLTVLDSSFDISIWALTPLALVLFLAMKKVPALPTILAGALSGCVIAVIFQGDAIKAFVNNPELSPLLIYVKGSWDALATGFSIETSSDKINSLLSRGGMSSMMNTIWLIISAMTFGAVMEKTGLLQKLVRSIIGMAKSTGGLIGSVLLTCLGMNIIAADQYLAIVLPGRMYRAEFKRRGLDAKNLSRTLEDAGTITSPLIPWNTCGVYMASTLGVATFAYLPFCFFNLVNPIVSFIYGITNFKIAKHAEG